MKLKHIIDTKNSRINQLLEDIIEHDEVKNLSEDAQIFINKIDKAIKTGKDQKQKNQKLTCQEFTNTKKEIQQNFQYTELNSKLSSAERDIKLNKKLLKFITNYDKQHASD